MSKLHVTIERHPNEYITTYNLGEDITPYPNSLWLCLVDGKLAHAAGANRFTDPRMKTVDKRATALAESIFTIPGVVTERFERPVSIKRDTLRVVRDKTRADEDVEHDVIAAIATAFELSVDDITVSLDDHQRSEEYLTTVGQGRRDLEIYAALDYEYDYHNDVPYVD